jgi:N,N'-diacetylchitobiose transport system substrate-binding protein
MRVRIVAVVGVVALALVAATTGTARTSSPASAKATSITVWLMPEAQNGWADVVANANKAFKQQHPGVDVKVETQSWGEHLTKLDAALAGGNAPDVVELGNTETVKYMAGGALASLKKSDFPNSSTWLPGLTKSCTYGGKTLCVPYYAGARAVIYNKALFSQAGINSTPKSLAELVTDGQKLMKKFGKDSNFSALYWPGKYWYGAMAFVYDYGGQIATTRKGKWVGALNSPKAIQALTVMKSVVTSLSRASKTGDEANPQQSLVFAKGKVGAFLGNGWEWGYALDPKVGNPSLASSVGAFPMPSHVKGKFMPTFLGGSDLAIPVTSKNQDLAADWLKAFTSSDNERLIASEGQQIANTTTLASVNASNPQLAPFAQAAASSWFVPAAPNWAKVESANVLQNMLVEIVSGRRSVKAAADRASKLITEILNSSA